MIAWFAALSCSHALAVLIAIVLVIGSLWLYRATRPRPMATLRRTAHVVDYSAARAKAIEWLGDRYLLSKSINRRVAPRTSTARRRQQPMRTVAARTLSPHSPRPVSARSARSAAKEFCKGLEVTHGTK